MLIRDDIESDLARGDAEDLRDTFDALVQWGGASEVEGVTSAAALMDLFKRVCGAMGGCMDFVPPETLRALEQRMAVDITTAVATYDGAARFALQHSRGWWYAFTQSFPEAET